MKDMFRTSPWSGPLQGPVHGVGFRPGPVQVKIVGAQGGNFNLSGPAQSRPLPFRKMGAAPAQQPSHMEGDCSDGSCSLPPPSQVQANRVPMGKKTDCPVCKSFGGKSGF